MDTLKILVAPQKGVNWARNTGLEHARGNVVLFIDDDCVVTDRHFVQRHVDLHQQHMDLAAVGGPYALPSSAGFWDHVYQKNNELWLEANQIAENRSLALLGGNASYKKHLLKRPYLFPTEITYGGSETPLNTLLSLKYGPLGYFKDLAITHDTSLGFFSLMKKASLQGRGAALQTKMYNHPLIKTPPLKSVHPWNLRWALEIYSLLFMVFYRANQKNQNLLLTLLLLSFTKITHSFQTQILSPISGFLTSLLETPPLWHHNLSLSRKIALRLELVARKMGWLLLKTVGLR